MYTIYLTTECNFNCTYCYEDYKEHLNLSKEKLIETLNFIFNYDKNKKISIGFMGGEPLLRKELIFYAIEYIDNNFFDRDIKYYLTTNCSLLDDEFIEMIKHKQFNIRLSFDGTEYTHTCNRISKSKRDTYEKILNNVLKIRDKNIWSSVRMTVTANTLNMLYDNILFFHKNQLNSINMIFDINMELTGELESLYKDQVNKVADYYIEENLRKTEFNIDQFDGKFINILGEFGNHFSMCGAGDTSVSIMPDGNIYPCAYLTNNKQYIIGNIKSTIDKNYAKEIPLRLFNNTLLKCKDCNIKDFCHGMKCGYMNYITTGFINIPSDALCKQENINFLVVKRIINEFMRDKKTLEFKLHYPIKFLKNYNISLNPLGLEVKNKLLSEQIYE